MNNVPAKRGRRDLAPPRVDVNDLVTLADANLGLQELKGTWEAEYKTAVEREVGNAGKRVTKRRLLFGTQDYDCLDGDFFGKACYEMQKRMIQELYPCDIISEAQRGISQLPKLLGAMKEEDSTFLGYFFLTPVDRAVFERYLQEVVPVTESTSALFGLFSETRTRPFTKTAHEQGSIQTEDMQMIPSPLTEEHIGFYVAKILNAAGDYDTAVKRCAGLLSEFRAGEIEPSDHHIMDVSIMNHSLEGLGSKPYSPKTGAFALLLYRALMRMERRVRGITDNLYDTLSDIYPRSYDIPGRFAYAAERAGFEVRRSSLHEPVHALRKVP